MDTLRDYFKTLQKRICQGLEAADGQATFIEDNLTRQEGGGGKTCVMQQGATFEKGGVNFSEVWGEALPRSATANRPELAQAPYRGMGVSLVIHPQNPYVPTVHANVRFFSVQPTAGKTLWWFGGGMDLTPYYGFEEDAIHWHQTCEKACGTHYESLKKWCDEYFFLKHRGETRGIGGVFFDDWNLDNNLEASFEVVRNLGDHFLEGYLPIVNRRKATLYGERERWFQEYRRGRYVEFNLVYDRGTLFGLQSGGRTESILMSLPPRARWEYNWTPAEGSAEETLYTQFLKPRDWLACTLNHA